MIGISVRDSYGLSVGNGVDIVVTSNAVRRPELVVEVKLAGSLDEATAQLVRYMQRVGAPLGLAIVDGALRILRDTYRASGPQAVEVVCDASTDGIPALALPDARNQGPARALEFVARVQAWLESVPNADTLSSLPEPLQSAARDYLVPVIEGGIVSAAGPRVARMGAA